MLSSGCLQSRYLLSWNILTLLSFWRSHRLLDCGLLGRDIFACPHCPYHLIVGAAAATTVAIANCYYRHWAIDTFFVSGKGRCPGEASGIAAFWCFLTSFLIILFISFFSSTTLKQSKSVVLTSFSLCLYFWSFLGLSILH